MAKKKEQLRVLWAVGEGHGPLPRQGTTTGTPSALRKMLSYCKLARCNAAVYYPGGKPAYFINPDGIRAASERSGGKKRHGGERGPEYMAHFEPQAWVNDYAMPVDADGETDWNVTAFVGTLDEETQANIEEDTRDGGHWTDDDDELARDPKRPRWVKQWSGPFTITVSRVEKLGGKKRHAQPKVDTLASDVNRLLK